MSAALQANQLRKEASDGEGSGESGLMPERKEQEREDDVLLQQLNEMGFTDVAATRALLQQLPGQTSVTKEVHLAHLTLMIHRTIILDSHHENTQRHPPADQKESTT